MDWVNIRVQMSSILSQSLNLLLFLIVLSSSVPGSSCQNLSIRNETTNILLNQLLSQAKADKQAYDQKFDLYIQSLQKLIQDLENTTLHEKSSPELSSSLLESRLSQLETKLSAQIQALSKNTNQRFAEIEVTFSENLDISMNSLQRKLDLLERHNLIQNEQVQNLSVRVTALLGNLSNPNPSPIRVENVETIGIELKSKPANSEGMEIDLEEPQSVQAPPSPPNPSPEPESESDTESDSGPIYRDCCEAYKNGKRSSGTYKLNIFNNKSVSVVCDMSTEGGGWTVLQRRILEGPTVNFNRKWTEYEEGFGGAPYSYWIGLKHISQLTKTMDQEVRFDMEAFSSGTKKEKGKAYAKYKKFHVAGPGSMYKLTIDNYYGNAGNSMMRSYPDLELSGMYFTTKDKDNDLSSVENCANGRGGWWHNQCSAANVNGLLYTAQTYDPKSLTWHTFNSWNSLKYMEMKVRNKKPALCGVSAN